MWSGWGQTRTATHFIKLLAARATQSKIRAIASSTRARNLPNPFQFQFIDFQQCSEIDVAIDGADEIGPGLALFKCGEVPSCHEKIVASASMLFIIIADSSKVVTRLGKFPLPVEVIPTASPLVARKLVAMGIRSTIRRLNSGSEFITDEGNLILDCQCGEIQNPDALAASIRNIVGVVEHALFLHMAERALVSDGFEVRPY